MEIIVRGAKLTIDGQKKETTDLTQDFLNEVVSESLQGNVEYTLEGDHPLVTFFQTLRDETKKGSALRQKKEEMEAAQAQAKANGQEQEAKSETSTQIHNSELSESSLLS